MNHKSNLPQNPNINIRYDEKNLHHIWLAGGCFWGVEAYFARILGVAKTTVGYANGKTDNPTYHDIDRTGHAETIEVSFDPSRIRLEELLVYYFNIIDPTAKNRQGNDVGTQYRTGIYYQDEADQLIIQAVIANEQKKYNNPIVTEVKPLQNYSLAEEYHQDYLEKNPNGYCHIDFSSLPKTAKVQVGPTHYRKPSQDEIEKSLTDIQYKVTQKSATEQPFKNEYWNNHEQGIYVDIVTGEPLFVSSEKFDSGCGWPSFSRPIDNKLIVQKQDKSHSMQRIEVRSGIGDSHLGHLFDDGPKEEGGLRYCINSASLRFIPQSEMESKGYGSFIPLIEKE